MTDSDRVPALPTFLVISTTFLLCLTPTPSISSALLRCHLLLLDVGGLLVDQGQGGGNDEGLAVRVLAWSPGCSASQSASQPSCILSVSSMARFLTPQLCWVFLLRSAAAASAPGYSRYDNKSSLDRLLKFVHLVKAAHAIVDEQQRPGLNDELPALLVPVHGRSQTRRGACLAACVHSLGTEVRY